ncbi:MAG TPA: DUF2993 domain-containing protein [Coleofasciculaceae cyanobacterium]|jgi:hypothetical protein
MNNKSNDNFDFQKTVINKAAEAAIASQIESAKNVEVEVDSETSQIIHGEVNSLKIIGEKIIAVQDIQLEQIDITSDNLSLNIAQALLGKISFEQPGNFKVKIIFTESDCDRLLNSEYVKILLQNLSLEVTPQSANFYIEQAKCHLKDDGHLSLVTTIVLNREQQIKIARFEIALQVCRDGTIIKVIKFNGGRYLENQTLDLDETVAIMSKISALLYLRDFSNADLALNITGVEVKAQKLILQGNAQVKRLPNSITQSLESVASKINQT